MVDPTYGILTPFYQDGIGTLFTKQLIKNKYLEEEIAEKIRLFYVALTRAKEKMIMVLPEFKEGSRIKERATYLTEMKYRSFYDFLSSMSLNLKDYTRVIDVKTLGLSKDYEYGKSKKMPTIESDEVMEVHPIFINKDVVNTTHASKTILNLISYEEAQTMAYGTKIHEMLEETDYLVKNTNNKYVKQILDTFDFDNASIYQEFEFIFLRDEVEYHGIIDLMLEYDDEIKIIDYKLKNIEDEAYVKQLNVYYEYIRSVSDKKVTLYLYSIMDNKLQEVEVLGLLE